MREDNAMSICTNDPFVSGSIVWIHSMDSSSCNGKTALVMRETCTVTPSEGVDAAAGGCCSVQMLDDDSIASIPLNNLARSPPSIYCIRAAPGTGGVGVYATQDIEAGVVGFIPGKSPVCHQPQSRILMGQ